MSHYYSIFLDDERFPTNVSWIEIPSREWLIIRSYKQFVKTVMDLGPPSFISYDHDLAREHYPTTDDHQAIDYDKYTEKTGYDCAKWMVKYCADHDIKHPKYLVHSLNPIGRLNIKSYVESYNKSCN